MTARSGEREVVLPASILLPSTTFVVLGYEIALTRLFAYLFPYQLTVLAVSFAVLGLGAGAYARVRWFTRLSPPTLSIIAHLGSSASLLGLYVLLMFTHRVLAIIVLSAVPFVFAGMGVSVYYEIRRSDRAWTTYALDLAGGAAGCVAGVLLLIGLGADGALLGLAALASGAAAFASMKAGSRHPRSALALGALCLVLLAGTHLFRSRWPDPLLDRHSSLDKALPQVLREQGGEVIDTAWSAVGRADLYQRADRPGMKVILTDAMTSTAFLGAGAGSLRDSLAFVPYAIAPVRTALILGSGGGLEVRMAREASVADVEAVEVNAAVIRLVRRWARFGGPVYDQPGVTLFVEEARKFVLTRSRRYDLIQMSLVLTASAQSGTYALAEAYLYTEEAFRSYLDHLEPNGALAMIDDDPERTVRNAVTAVSVLQRALGRRTDEAMRHVAVFFNPREDEPGYRYLLLVSPEPLSDERIRGLAAEASRRPLAVLWLPGVAAAPAFQALARLGVDALVRAAPLNLAPTTDDRPHFYNFAKGPAQVLQLVRPYLMLSAAMLAALIVMFAADGTSRDAEGRRATALAALFGVGFMLIELGLLHKLTLAVGGPTYVLSVLLFALLLSCGLGSLLAGRLAPSCRTRLGSCAIVVAVVGVATAEVVERYYLLAGVSSSMLRIACVLAFVAPIGLCLGAPFPDLLRRYGASDDRRLAYLWAVNGVGSVLGAGLTLILSLLVGAHVVLLAGSGLYLLAWTIDR